CCRKDHLRVGYTIILNEYHLQLAADGSVIVYHIRHRVDQLDDLLSSVVGCGSLCSKDKGPWIEIHLRMGLDLVIQVDHMKDIQKLALVLVKSLSLHVKDGTWIHFHSIVLQDVFCQAHL